MKKREKRNPAPEGKQSRPADQLPVTWGRTGRWYFPHCITVNAAHVTQLQSLPFALIHFFSGSLSYHYFLYHSALLHTKALQYPWLPTSSTYPIPQCLMLVWNHISPEKTGGIVPVPMIQNSLSLLLWLHKMPVLQSQLSTKLPLDPDATIS